MSDQAETAPLGHYSTGSRVLSKRQKITPAGGFHLRPALIPPVHSVKLFAMPIELIVEMFRTLTPLDILHLARTTKAFRTVLLRSSSSWIWENARKTIPGLLGLPSFLNEAEYADLLFESYCHNCLDPGYRDGNMPVYIMWEFRARYCGPCRKSILLKHSDLEVPPLPHGYDWNPTRYLCHADEHQAWLGPRPVYHATQLQELISALNLVDPASSVDEQRVQIIRQFSAHTRNIMENYRPFKEWARNREEARMHIITRRLNELRFWTSEVSPQRLLAQVVECALLPEFRAIIDPDTCPEVLQVAPITPYGRMFASLRASFTKCAEESLARANSYLARAIRIYFAATNDSRGYSDTDLLKLARLLFSCKLCSKEGGYPWPLEHNCGTVRANRTYEDTQPYGHLVRQILKAEPWSPDIFVVSPNIDLVNKTMVTFGFDPRTTTMDEINAAGPAVVCTASWECPSSPARNWESAIDHCLRYHSIGALKRLTWNPPPAAGSNV